MTTEHDPRGMTRRQLIRHSAWFGSAVVLSVVGGEVISHIAGSSPTAPQSSRPTLRFAQISDSHIGFNGPANPHVADTFTDAINQVNSLGYTPDFVIHTGDLTHLATPEQFDQVKQMLTGLNTPHIFTVPGDGSCWGRPQSCGPVSLLTGGGEWSITFSESPPGVLVARSHQ